MGSLGKRLEAIRRHEEDFNARCSRLFSAAASQGLGIRFHDRGRGGSRHRFRTDSVNSNEAAGWDEESNLTGFVTVALIAPYPVDRSLIP